MNAETDAWLTKARDDYKAALVLFDAGLTDAACFHCQQSAEKCLKGLLSDKGERIPRTHDLESLIDFRIFQWM